MNELNEMDFSSILSASSVASSTNKTVNNSILSNNSVDETYRSDKISVTVENVDANLIRHLNQELAEMGLESIYSNRSSNDINFSMLFRNTVEVLDRLKRQLLANDRIQEQ